MSTSEKYTDKSEKNQDKLQADYDQESLIDLITQATQMLKDRSMFKQELIYSIYEYKQLADRSFIIMEVKRSH